MIDAPPCDPKTCKTKRCDHRWMTERERWLRICALAEVLVDLLRGNFAGPIRKSTTR